MRPAPHPVSADAEHRHLTVTHERESNHESS
jgi:hypothetical protein